MLKNVHAYDIIKFNECLDVFLVDGSMVCIVILILFFHLE